MEEKCPTKKLKRNVEDRISELPDEILVHILSFLTLEDGLRTSALSKRWTDVWLSVSALDFDSRKLWEGLEIQSLRQEYQRLLGRNRGMYVKWVNGVLQSHQSNNNNNVLDALRIRYDLNISNKKDIDEWIKYAFSKGVERLELNLFGSKRLWGYGNSNESYVFSLDLLLGSDQILFGLKYLRSLAFRKVNILAKVIEFLLHNCPFLESLTVETNRYLYGLNIRGPSLALKHLEVIDSGMLGLTICDTNIVSIKVSDDMLPKLNKVDMLVDINVSSLTQGLVRCVKWLSPWLSNLEVLTLQDVYFIDRPHSLDWCLGSHGLPKLKQLTLVILDLGLYLLTDLIRASHNLEKFVLKCECTAFHQKRLRRLSKQKQTFPKFKHIKQVEFHGFKGDRSQLELMEYFVENAAEALQRIVVDSRFFRLSIDNGEIKETVANSKYKNRAGRQQLQGLLVNLPLHVELLLNL